MQHNKGKIMCFYFTIVSQVTTNLNQYSVTCISRGLRLINITAKVSFIYVNAYMHTSGELFVNLSCKKLPCSKCPSTVTKGIQYKLIMTFYKV